MRVQAIGCAVVMVGLSLVSCQGATELEGVDDMAASNGEAGQGPGPGTCFGCFDSPCAWQSQNCAGDPECARWMSCARACGPGEADTPAASCLDACPQPSSHGGLQLRQDLRSCIDQAGGCCSGAIKGPGADSGPTDNADAAAGTYDGQVGPSAPTSCAGATCLECLRSIQENVGGCVAQDSGCAQSVGTCMHEPAAPGAPFGDVGNCANFALSFAGCATDPSFASHTIGQCVWVVPPESVDTTLDAIGCGAAHCSACAPSGDETCLACEIDACRFEMGALLGDADAQGLYWCLRTCATSSDLAACRSGCGVQYANGVPVLTALNQCVAGSCADKCGN